MGVPKRLTEMQQRFAEFLVFGDENGPLTKTEAALRAGYSPKRARQEGSELTNPRLSPLVVKHIGELKEERLRKHEVTYEGHVAELARLREAALRAGYSPKRARQEGSELTNPRLSPLVVKHIGELKEERLRKHEVTYEGHVAELARLREAALKKGSFSSAVNAEANRGKAAGLYIDRKIIKTGKLEDLSEQELENKMKQILSDYAPLLDAKQIEGEVISSESSSPNDEGSSSDLQK